MFRAGLAVCFGLFFKTASGAVDENVAPLSLALLYNLCGVDLYGAVQVDNVS
jgi:hypothetical protein